MKVVDWPMLHPDRRIWAYKIRVSEPLWRGRGHGLLSRDRRERSAWIEAVTVIYLITFACYGCHLHGDPSGSVDRHHNLPGGRLLKADPQLLQAELRSMDQTPYRLDVSRRRIVLDALLDRCRQQEWKLLAAHVRTNHVHLVVEAEARPERVMNDLKSYASRCLNQKGTDEPARKRWARHGSTRWLWKPDHVSAAIRYVVDEQGEAMAVFQAVEA